MRLWSIHPKYLDTRGLTALWREGLLAQAVLGNKTKGYKNHPQLIRFLDKHNPLETIGVYLHYVQNEAEHRGYHFNASKILHASKTTPIKSMGVTRGQLQFEWEHLRKKLTLRDPDYLKRLGPLPQPQPHPLFKVVAGGIADWERI